MRNSSRLGTRHNSAIAVTPSKIKKTDAVILFVAGFGLIGFAVAVYTFAVGFGIEHQLIELLTTVMP